jgi:hypothetical protein
MLQTVTARAARAETAPASLEEDGTWLFYTVGGD